VPANSRYSGLKPAIPDCMNFSGFEISESLIFHKIDSSLNIPNYPLHAKFDFRKIGFFNVLDTRKYKQRLDILPLIFPDDRRPYKSQIPSEIGIAWHFLRHYPKHFFGLIYFTIGLLITIETCCYIHIFLVALVCDGRLGSCQWLRSELRRSSSKGLRVFLSGSMVM